MDPNGQTVEKIQAVCRVWKNLISFQFQKTQSEKTNWRSLVQVQRKAKAPLYVLSFGATVRHVFSAFYKNSDYSSSVFSFINAICVELFSSGFIINSLFRGNQGLISHFPGTKAPSHTHLFQISWTHHIWLQRYNHSTPRDLCSGFQFPNSFPPPLRPLSPSGGAAQFLRCSCSFRRCFSRCFSSLSRAFRSFSAAVCMSLMRRFRVLRSDELSTPRPWRGCRDLPRDQVSWQHCGCKSKTFPWSFKNKQDAAWQLFNL